jgi:hypothetical protein
MEMPHRLASDENHGGTAGTATRSHDTCHSSGGDPMGRGLLLWLIGIPLPIILLIWLFGGLHG